MTHSPATESDLAAIVADARAKKTTLAIAGGGTRAGLGRPAAADAVLSTLALAGVTLYEPAEMVFSARAGTLLRDIEAMLAEKGQSLPFEPMDSRALYGSTGEPTIGAVAACNVSGPRRVQLGAARDQLIGLRLVNGRGESVKSGAMGTLGGLTEVTFKALPAAPDSGALVCEGLDDIRAVECLCAAMGSPFEVGAAAHLPAGLGDAPARTLLRIEHVPESVGYRLDRLAGTLREFGTPARLNHEATRKIFANIRDVAPLAEPRDAAVWKISTAPAKGPATVAAIAAKIAATWLYDWSGGLVWLATPALGDCGAAAVRAAVAANGGHATLARAPQAARRELDVFQPLAEPLMKLSRGIKSSFDPDGVLNFGRMYAGV